MTEESIKASKEKLSNKLKNAINRTIFNHPVLLSRFHQDENGEIFIEYRPDLPPEIKIINIKDYRAEIKTYNRVVVGHYILKAFVLVGQITSNLLLFFFSFLRRL